VSLRARLVLAAAYLLVVVVIALEFPLAVNIERRAQSEFRSTVLGYAGVTASQIADQVGRITQAEAAGGSGSDQDRASVDRVVSAYATQSGARVVVVDASGRVISDSTGEAAPGTLYETPERPEFQQAISTGQPSFDVRPSETLGQDLLVVVVPIMDGSTVVGAVRFSAPLGTITHRVHVAWIGLVLIGLAVIAAGLALAWVLATSLAKPVHRLEHTAEEFGSGNLRARASPDGPAEVAALATSFNRMADAVGSSIESQRDFVANASHQLRTPLTGMRLRLEAIEQEGGPAAEDARKALAEVDRLSALVDDLLELTRASLAATTGAAVDLSRVAADAVERWWTQAGEAGVELRLDAGTRRTVLADAKDLGQVLDNLLENAIKYSPGGSRVVVRTLDESAHVVLTVADDGPGIPEAERERLFERFFRGSTGRRGGPGTGLGLAIVEELVTRWGGTVRLAPSAPGAGATFEVSFPALGSAASAPNAPRDTGADGRQTSERPAPVPAPTDS
jgi:signal transduction histidine kinase